METRGKKAATRRELVQSEKTPDPFSLFNYLDIEFFSYFKRPDEAASKGKPKYEGRNRFQDGHGSLNKSPARHAPRNGSCRRCVFPHSLLSASRVRSFAFALASSRGRPHTWIPRTVAPFLTSRSTTFIFSYLGCAKYL